MNEQKRLLVQEQSGNITYDITGFKRIEIQDDLKSLHLINPESTEELYSICACFNYEGTDGEKVVLGHYADYGDACSYYNDLIAKISAGNTFVSMVPGEDREIIEREG